MVKLPATIPLAPRFPFDKSAMCMEPPRPLQYPSSRPKSSANILYGSAPLPKQWPCPLWVEVIKSFLSNARHAPAAVASCPIERCIVPCRRPRENISSNASSNNLISIIIR